MSNDYEEFLKLLNYHKVKYVVVGAHAVTAHSRPKTTGDMDILIETAEENTGLAGRGKIKENEVGTRRAVSLLVSYNKPPKRRNFASHKQIIY